MRSLDAFAEEKLRSLEERSLRRALLETEREPRGSARRDGRRVVSFSCNDYLNLSQHPEVKRAAKDAIDRYGAGAGGSRLITGNHPLYLALEEKLARLKGAEAALVFGSGYLANLGILPSLTGPDDLVLADELSHACLLAGAKLSSARTLRFAHNDTAALARLLDEERAKHPRCLIVTDGVFSMDGDLAPLPALARLAEEHDAWLLSDDAHGLGVTGGGRGSAFAFGPEKVPVPLQMGTLSKAAGSYGGYLCASAPVIELLKSRARTLVYSTGLPPSTVAASLAALDLIERDPALCARPVEHARRFASYLGLPAPDSAIVPVVLGSAGAALRASEALLGGGFLVTAIRPPTVPEGSARLRFAFTAGHDDDDVERAALLVKERVLSLRDVG